MLDFHLQIMTSHTVWHALHLKTMTSFVVVRISPCKRWHCCLTLIVWHVFHLKTMTSFVFCLDFSHENIFCLDFSHENNDIACHLSDVTHISFFFFHGALCPQKPYCLLGTGRRGGGGGYGGGGRGKSYTFRYTCHHQNNSSYIKMGSVESHFNVSVGSDGQSHKTVSTNHNLFEEKREPKRNRAESLPSTSLTPYR